MNRRAWTLLSCRAIWGASYLLIKIGLATSAGDDCFLRVVLAAAVLLAPAGGRDALGGFRPARRLDLSDRPHASLGAFVLIAAGEQEISSSLAESRLVVPLSTALLAIRVTRRSVRGLRLWSSSRPRRGCARCRLSGSATSCWWPAVLAPAGLGYAIGGPARQAQTRDQPPIESPPGC